MSASFAPALAAAHAAASAQHYPQGALYVVATPIGNLADMTLRALHVLQLADTVACEDTRHTQHMLRAYGIDKSAAQLLAVHQHNESEAAHAVVQRLQAGQRVAYVSDAGTPGVSDPGARLVAVLAAQGLRCIPVPGVSSVTAVFSVAGNIGHAGHMGHTATESAPAQPSDAVATGFAFIGFLPTKAQERAHAVQALGQTARAVVLLEAPHRIEATAQALSILGSRRITVGRELTKQFEEIATLAAQDFPAWLAGHANRLRGEFALVLHAATVGEDTQDHDRVLRLLLAELPMKSAVKLTAEITGASRNALYARALALKNTTLHDGPEAQTEET